MAFRILDLAFGISDVKQSNISTIGASHLKWSKLNRVIHSPEYNTETDAGEVGIGNEFGSNVFPTNWDMKPTPIEKFGSAQFMTWALAYGLGNVAYATNTYTITPITAATGLQLPFFSLVQQAAEGGGTAIDEAFVGCAIEEVAIDFQYGPGRQSVKVTPTIVWSGNLTRPSGVTLPTNPQVEQYFTSSAMSAITLNGTDYVAASTMLTGSFRWKNNILLGMGYHPGSGSASGAAVRDRMYIGDRSVEFSFRALLTNGSAELTKLIAQTGGTGTLTFYYDATHQVTITIQSLKYQAVDRGVENGLVTVDVTGRCLFDPTNGVVSVSAKCGVANFAQ